MIFLLILILWWSGVGTALTQPVGEPSVEAYTLLPLGARAIGLHGAFTAVANDPTALWHNPAGLALLPRFPQFSLMGTAMSFGRMLNILGYAQQVFPSFGIGAGVVHHRAGKITARRANGQLLGEYENDQLLAQASVAYQLASVSIGVGAKYLLNLLRGADIRSDGYAFDVGVLFRAPYFALGFAAKNLLGTVVWNNEDRLKESLRYMLNAGVAVEIPFAVSVKVVRSELGKKKYVYKRSSRYVLVTAEAQWIQQEAHARIFVGAEIVPVEEIHLRLGIPVVQPERAGLRYFAVGDFTLGLSLQPRIPDLPFFLQIDYAVSQDYLTTTSRFHHHFGLTLLWW